MRYGPIDIPKQVIDALADGSLAVFAGAGVSYDPPSNYPDFVGLAKEARAALDFADDRYEPVDQYFGRLDRARRNRVHTWVRDRLSRADSLPNAHHITLLRLFRSPDQMRVVTTNFDRHFSTAATEVLRNGAPVEEWHAPALPVGSNFAGLVYLHGDVNHPADRLVLTDRDFGRAYLTEGWACRFLVDLFRTYTVLFVGYSGADTVVQYLARGLSPEGKKAFAFASSDDDANHWSTLHVNPILYHASDKHPGHSALWAGLDRLVEDVARNAIDHERRAKALLSQPPPVSNTDDSDYLAATLNDPMRVAFFQRHALTWDWVEWADQQGLLSAAFDPLLQSSEHLRDVCAWLATRMASQPDDAGFRLFVKREGKVSAALWKELLYRFSLHGEFGQPFVRSWITTLLDCCPPYATLGFELRTMVKRLRPSESPELALAIFRHLARARLSASIWDYPGLADDNGNPRIEYKIEYAEHGDCLRDLWTTVLTPNLPSVASTVALDVAAALLRHRRLWCLGHSSPALPWGECEIYRPDVAICPEHNLHDTVHVLVDIHLECLGWLVANAPDDARSLAGVWTSSEAPILRRIAFHAMLMDAMSDPEVVLNHAIAKGWLVDDGAVSEVNQLVGSALVHCDEKSRTTFLSAASQCWKEVEFREGLKEGYADWRVFALLGISAPDIATSGGCAANVLAGIRTRHPDWIYPPRVHPTGVQVTDIRSLPAPISVDELLAKPASEQIEFLSSFKGGSLLDGQPTRINLCDVVAQAVKQSPRWGLDLAELLRSINEGVETDLWHAIVHGLRDAPLTDRNWGTMLDVFSRSALPASVLSQVGFLLSNGLERKENRISDARFPAVSMLCRHLLALSGGVEAEGNGEDPKHGWASRSLNHAAGSVVQCVLGMALRQHQAAPDAWTGLSEEARETLEGVLSDGGMNGKCARTMLAIYFAHFHFLDRAWAEAHILPLFAWTEANRPEAERAWSGHGEAGRIFPDAAMVVLPLYADAIKHWESLSDGALNGLSIKLVQILLWSRLSDAERQQHAGRISADGGPKTRKAFATQIGAALQELDAEDRQRNWRSWILSYLIQRVSSPSAPASGEELAAFLWWAPDVPEFTEYVNTVTRSCADVGVHCHVSVPRTTQGGRNKAVPDDTVKLLLWILGHSDPQSWVLSSFDKIAAELVVLPSPPNELELLLVKLAEKGSSKATPLHDELRRRRSGEPTDGST